MKTLKFLLPILAWALCCGGMVTESNHSRGIIVSEAMGLAAARCSSLSSQAGELAKAAGLGYGASALLQEWQNQQAIELETLIARNNEI
ncbi:hypothetical protein [Chlamydia caviae]|uniref:Uncharacterized protein n=1 Tax=Chlamydia caviae (strain ATCC VR-813 / DSM 19441 / 03DC25 / GPIC) TaxID=227941 RepID=Q821V8_CHLCV|nr:hypothetical protein [Chlamydia caviae]AAP05568.1 conserved hypothetical protein [Chlamydia caviae GPIC]